MSRSHPGRIVSRDLTDIEALEADERDEAAHPAGWCDWCGRFTYPHEGCVACSDEMHGLRVEEERAAGVRCAGTGRRRQNASHAPEGSNNGGFHAGDGCRVDP